jgi:hypothetical protein
MLEDYKTLWLEQLTGEYKMLQDKIDKIAGFRFTIRGWSLTAVVAATIGSFSTNTPPPPLALALLIPFVVAFFIMEYLQIQHSLLFEGRLIDIEDRIRRILTKNDPARIVNYVGFVPRTAHELRAEAAASWKPWRRLVSIGNWLFYSIEILVIVAGIWLQQHIKKPTPIGIHVKYESVRAVPKLVRNIVSFKQAL